MISTHFVSDQQEELDYKIAEVQMIKDQLAVMDAKIDRYDTIIQNIDKQIIPLLDEINVSISSVKTAYDNRIAVNCRNNLYWEVSFVDTYEGILSSLVNDPTYQQTVYTCKKNPNVGINYGYYGAKYYRKPQNQDYGSNIVREFFGTIGAGSTILAVFGVDGTANLLVGDNIIDNIDNPVLFSSSNLPTIVGFGTTTIADSTIDFGGSIGFGSTIIAHTGVGSTGDVNIGDSIILATLLDPSTSVVGFGTTTIIVDNIWDPGSGSFISTSAITDSLIISIPAISTGTGTFKIGALTTYPSLILSTPSQDDGVNFNFTDIRNTQDSYTVFDYSNNPIDPVTVGILGNNTLGFGHKLVKVTDGSPVGPFQWNEVMTADFANKPTSQLNGSQKYLRKTYPEPKCGAGYADYYPGDTSWPIINDNTYDFAGILIGSLITYAQEGDTVVVGSGQTVPTSIGYTATKPVGAPSNSDCTNIYDAAITAAETSRDAIIAKNEPIIDALVASSMSLRSLRDTLESRAFAMLQGRIYADVEINNLKANLAILQVSDFTPFEPKSYYYNSEEGKYNSSTLGIATV